MVMQSDNYWRVNFLLKKVPFRVVIFRPKKLAYSHLFPSKTSVFLTISNQNLLMISQILLKKTAKGKDNMYTYMV